MNRFEELLAAGRMMSREERQVALLRIFQMPQAAALVVAVREHWEAYARAISKQEMAAHHGCVEHCAGSLHGVETIENVLRGAAASTEKKRES